MCAWCVGAVAGARCISPLRTFTIVERGGTLRSSKGHTHGGSGSGTHAEVQSSEEGENGGVAEGRRWEEVGERGEVE